MNIDFNDFLRTVTCILIILLVFQGLDYIFGFGVNNYIFIVFCIVFAFAVGSIYHNVLINRKSKGVKAIRDALDKIQEDIDKEYADKGLSSDLLNAQVTLNKLKEDLEFNESVVFVDKNVLEQVRYELVTLDGLYCSDLEDFSESWRLDLSKVIRVLDDKLN